MATHWAYSAVLQSQDGPKIKQRMSIGYCAASNEDEANGIAARKARELSSGPEEMVAMTVAIELKGLAVITAEEEK